MAMNEKTRLMVNRIVSAIAGGLLVLAIMSFTVVKNANNRNEALTSALDTSQYEAGRLLADAEVQYKAGDYAEAKASLESLFANQPGSAETTQGKDLMVAVESAQREANQLWEDALPGIRAEWQENLATEMRAEAEAATAKMESTLDATVTTAWEKAKGKVREEWESLQS